MSKPDLLVLGAPKPLMLETLENAFTVHLCNGAEARETLPASLAARIVAVAVNTHTEQVGPALMAALPRLQIVASFGVGYDHIDAAWAGEHGIVVTNTPDVLTEEVADLTLGLLLCTVRELPQAAQFLREGRWKRGAYPLTEGTLRDRKIGLLGMGRIGQAVARRLDSFAVHVVYHARRENTTVPYRYYSHLLDMAHEVDTLIAIVPGGPETHHLINGAVLEALGPRGILISVGRGSVVDEAALIDALRERKIHAAGLDVFEDEPNVPQDLLDLENVVLLPHVGSASVYTRAAMARLQVDNLLSWIDGKGPITPVFETSPQSTARQRET